MTIENAFITVFHKFAVFFYLDLLNLRPFDLFAVETKQAVFQDHKMSSLANGQATRQKCVLA